MEAAPELDKKQKKKQKYKEQKFRQKKHSQKKQQAQAGEQYSLDLYKIGSPKFDQFYQRQLPQMDAKEFSEFNLKLQERLPVTFRVNPNLLFIDNFINVLQDPMFI